MNRHRVLILDGHAETRAALAVAFSELRWSILSASSLAQGLSMLESRPDCVVLDLVLHDGEGETLLRKIRGSDQADLPPVVAVVTIETDAIRLGEVAKLRPDVLLLKPMDPRVVARLCGSEMEDRAERGGHEQH
jgi:DNA-binding response OmpR family regulator